MDNLNNNKKKRIYKPVPLLDGIEEIKQDFEERLEQGDITYGIEILDDAVQTVRKGSMTFIIAAPNTGKSLFGLKIAIHFAKQGKRVLICSCEMGAGLLMEREIKRVAGIGMNDLKNLYASRRDTANKIMDSFIESSEYEYMKRIDICETGGATVQDIIGMLEADQNYDAVVVDYIQRIKGIGSEYEVITDAARELQTYAREKKIYMICCSQANRQSGSEAQTTEKGQKVIDGSRIRGKGSGSIEEDADVGITLMELHENLQKFILVTLFKNRYGSIKNISYKYKLDDRLNLILVSKTT